MLEKFLVAHNSGTEVAFERFIKDTYNPELYNQVDLDKHVAFYRQIVNDFGSLNPKIYHTVEASSLKFIVHLIKDNETVLNKDIGPADILVVEIDLFAKNKNYLDRGLGLGALICEKEKGI